MGACEFEAAPVAPALMPNEMVGRQHPTRAPAHRLNAVRPIPTANVKYAPARDRAVVDRVGRGGDELRADPLEIALGIQMQRARLGWIGSSRAKPCKMRRRGGRAYAQSGSEHSAQAAY
jgi:hypothetical protein